MKVLFLYTELAGYTINCMKTSMEIFPELSIHVVRWPVNQEAPFQFDFGNVKVYEKEHFKGKSILEWAKKQNPDAIIASGWIDKEYNIICKYFVKKIPVVVALDNHWRGDFKQKLAAALRKWTVLDKFNTAWVPGQKQYDFALKLGIPKHKIFEGFYSADVSLFESYAQNKKSNKENKKFSKKILYVGRYVEHKGIFDMWNAFIELQNENPNDWELWCVGTGDQWENKIEHPQIKHLGFKQPDEFQEIIDQTSIYILPSHFEPWGVSLHEFVAAGFPILCSDKVGSSEVFCEDGKNGFIFKSENIQSLKESMRRVMQMNQEEFSKMSQESTRLSKRITPEIWSKTLIEIVKNGKN